MPLVPRLVPCAECGKPRIIAEASLLCERCGSLENVAIDSLGRLPVDWPLCHGEFMSLRCQCICTICEQKTDNYFRHGRVSQDYLPSSYENRVFIGGNYESIKDLRDIKAIVYELGSEFMPILPYDDFEIPLGQVYETDLRLLHNCKYAIFEVTHPGGELFEIARCAEYHVTTLLVYQAREFAASPPKVKTMLLESGNYEHRSYLTTAHLRQVVDEFLRQKNPLLWQRSISLIGYSFDSYSVKIALNKDGSADHYWSLKGLKVNNPNIKIYDIPQEFILSSGCIVKNSIHFDGLESMSWYRNETKSGDKAEVGVVRFSPPLDINSEPVNYAFTVRTQDAYLLTKQQLEYALTQETNDLFLEAGKEYVFKEIAYPIELLELSIEFPDGYCVNPQPSVYYGREPRSEGIKIPPDSWDTKDKIKTLKVYRPLIYHMYAITWELPDKLP